MVDVLKLDASHLVIVCFLVTTPSLGFQSVNILSSSNAQAEYRGFVNVVSQTCWLCNLLLELYSPPAQATLM